MDEARNELRVPPFNRDAERGILGAIFIDNGVFNAVSSIILEPEMFYVQSHRHIFRAMQTLHATGDVIDVITVADFLEEKHLLEQVGGTNGLARMTQDVPSSAHAVYYATIVARKYQLRELIGQARQLADDCYGNIEDFEAFMNERQARMMKFMRVSNRSSEIESVGEGAKEALGFIKERAASGDDLVGVSTGLENLDALTGGLVEEMFWVVGGRPGMGKSALATSIQSNLAKRKIPSLFFSLEMGRRQFNLRHLSLEAKIDSLKFSSLDLSKSELARLDQAQERLARRPMYYKAQAGLSIGEICELTRKAHQEYGVRVVFLDFIQLIQVPTTGREQPRRLEIKQAVYAMKELAKELSITIVGLSQLNRNVEHRPSKKPEIPDLEEAGAIEQSADVILFPYRPSVYFEDRPEGEAYFVVRKARDGKCGEAKQAWVGKYTLYTNCAHASALEGLGPISEGFEDPGEKFHSAKSYGLDDLK